jgi:hypothetical protein
MSFHLEYVHYRYQYVRCGRAGCEACPHGPYWYAYQKTRGKLKKTYVGRELPAAVLLRMKELWPAIWERLINHADS